MILGRLHRGITMENEHPDQQPPAARRGAKRTASQREADLELIGRLLVRGRTHSQIAAELNGQRPYSLTRQMVSIDVGLIRERWRQAGLESFSERQASALRKLDEVEAEGWKAWERSTADGGAGNPQFLRTVSDAIDRRTKLLGLDAPARTEISGPEGKPLELEVSAPPPDMTPEHVRALLARHASRAGIAPSDESTECAMGEADDGAGTDSSAG